MPRGKRAVALYLNRHKPSVRAILPKVLRFLRDSGAEPLGLDSQAADFPSEVRCLSASQLARRAQFALVMGGDGTFLSAARAFCRFKLPLAGMRLGHTGFLTLIESRGFQGALRDALDGKCIVESRSMVEARVVGAGGRIVSRGTALNDITLKQADMVKVVRLKLSLDGERLGDFTADGLVVATPTGATAYSLSAGGPVVIPGASILLATLLCPHTLSSRPIAFSPRQILEIHVAEGARGLRVSLDGQEALPMSGSQWIAVTGSRLVTRVLRPPGFSYPELLRTKLGWKS